MSLTGQLEFLLPLRDVVNVLVFLDSILAGTSFTSLAALHLLRVDLGQQVAVVRKQLLGIDLRDGIDWDIGSFMFKTTMNVDVRVNSPA